MGVKLGLSYSEVLTWAEVFQEKSFKENVWA